jgi:HEAT repeat protein
MTNDLSQLIADLSSPDAGERARAAEQLSRTGEQASAAAVPLVRAARDENEEVREWAVAALEELGSPSAADVASLAALVGDASPDVGYWAATLLGRLEHEAAAAVPQLTAALSAPHDSAVRQRAAWALGKIGPAAISASDALSKAAASDDPRLSRLAKQVLQQMATE